MKGATIRRPFRREPVEQPAPPSRIARQLALAHHIEALIDAGKLKDYAQAAEQLGLTRARLTQITSLLLLAPSIQAQILFGSKRPTERDLRTVSSEPEWEPQRTSNHLEDATNPEFQTNKRTFIK